ncbi:MAG: SDR family oxidoreductase [Deltaproteobacteria bacterium]|nr:SDR family oxidoreductase [Deltaproteobacteria bacterium]
MQEKTPKVIGVKKKARAAVVVTGISGRLGKLLAKRLHRTERVIGIDRRPFEDRPRDIEHHRIDIRRKRCEEIFRHNPVKAVVHLNILHDPRKDAHEHHTFNILGTTRTLEYAARHGVKKVVVLSSANIYGPSPENSAFLTEDAPILGSQHFSEIRDLIEVDMLANSFSWKHPEIETVILRTVHIVGHVRNAASNYLRLRRIPVVFGFDPMVQLIHEEDVVDAMVCALRPGVRGVFNIAGPETTPLSVIIRTLGKETIPFPPPLADSIVRFMWRWKLTSFPPPELHHLRFSCNVDDARAREVLKFAPRYGLKETLEHLRSTEK